MPSSMYVWFACGRGGEEMGDDCHEYVLCVWYERRESNFILGKEKNDNESGKQACLKGRSINEVRLLKGEQRKEEVN